MPQLPSTTCVTPKSTPTDISETASSYTRRVRVHSDGVYRVKVSTGDQDHLTGFSRRVRIDVH